MDIRQDVHLAHFQLRNILACSSRSHAFYAGEGVVHQINPISGAGCVAMAYTNPLAPPISTMAADHGVLVAGNFAGDYCLRPLESEYVGERRATHEGVITRHSSAITNHVKVHIPRGSASPHAYFASNDNCFREMDIATETFVSEMTFPHPLNCTAVSPDRRLRVMVGDSRSVLITTAQNERNADGRPEILHALSGHRDHGFACDWADDGYTVATGFQDRAVKIWDARHWTNSAGAPTPVCTLRTEMAGVRCLKFSPLGSGRRVLVAAEEADFINIIDAQTFRSKQTIDLFAEIGGVAFTNEGQDLYVLSCDGSRGGLVQLERCGGLADVTARERAWSSFSPTLSDWPDMAPPPLRSGAGGVALDWHPHGGDTGVISAGARRRREARRRSRLQAAALAGLEPF